MLKSDKYDTFQRPLLDAAPAFVEVHVKLVRLTASMTWVNDHCDNSDHVIGESAAVAPPVHLSFSFLSVDSKKVSISVSTIAVSRLDGNIMPSRLQIVH